MAQASTITTHRRQRRPHTTRSTGRAMLKQAVIVLTVLLGAAPLGFSHQASAVVAAPGCPEVLLIGARGSGEPESHHGLGPNVFTLYDALATGLAGKKSVKSLLVVYPARDVSVLRTLSPTEQVLLAAAIRGTPGAAAAFYASYQINHVNPFLASIDEGIRSAVDELRVEAKQCPGTRFVLAGYSQGAMVMHQALLRLESKGETGLLDRIAATVLIADGDRKKETVATRFGTAPFDAEGIRSAIVLGERDVPSSKASTTYDICNDGDLVCDFTLDALSTKARIKDAEKVHTDTYRNSTLVTNIGKRIAADLLAPSTPAATPRWVQDGYDAARSGVNPTENRLSPGNVASLRQAWQYTEPAGVSFTRPVMTDNTAFIVSYGAGAARLVAIDLATGTRRWQRPLNGNAYRAPLLTGRSVAVQTTSGVYTYATTDGSPQWSDTRLPLTSCAAGNMAVDGTTLYAFGQSSVAALDTVTGTARWTTPAAVLCFTGIAVTNGRLFAVSRSATAPPAAQQGQLRALDTSTGRVVWTKSTAVTMDAEPAMGNGLVFVGTQYGSQGLLAFDTQTGDVRWKRTDVLQYSQLPAITSNAVIVTSATGPVAPPTVRALNPETGGARWNTSVPGAVAGGDPVVANGLIYVGSRGNALAVHALRLDTGALVGTVRLGSGGANLDIDPIVANGMLLATVTPNPGSGDPFLRALRSA
jgi:outer membrane protein assembly factor BamB